MLFFVGIIVFILFIIGAKWRERILINRTYKERIERFQAKHHLSKSELTLFRETLGEAKDEILRIEGITKKYKQLAAIETGEAGIKSAKEIFKKLMENPQNINQLGDFLYQKLPGLVEATVKIEQIKQAELSTPEIEQSVAEILDTIQVLSASITDDYEQIIQLESEDIALTKKLVGRK